MGRENSPTKKSTAHAKSSTKATGLDEGTADSSLLEHPLVRDVSKGMNPRSILTGLYGSRGERIRHVVRNGALAMPQEVLKIMDAWGDSGNENAFANENDDEIENGSKNVNEDKAGNEIEDDDENKIDYKLPGLDVLVRPSLDKKLSSFTVTELHGKFEPSSDASKPPVFRTVAANRIIKRKRQEDDAPPDRIRGGGGMGSGGGEKGGNFQIPNFPPTSTADNIIPGQQYSVSGMTPPSQAASAASISSSNQHMRQSNFPSTAGSIQAQVTLTSAGTSSIPMPSQMHTSSGAARNLGPAGGSNTSASKVVPLRERPAAQWEQHMPGPNDEMQGDSQSKLPKPYWYQPEKISGLERALLPEWFNESAIHRTSETYINARETILKMSDQLGNRFVTSTLVRRTIPGDAGSLHRLHSFLASWFSINLDGMNDSAPTPSALLNRENKITWNDKRREELILAVVHESKKVKKRKLEHDHDVNDDQNTDTSPSSSSSLGVDWESIASKIGRGATAMDCEREFLSMPLNQLVESGHNQSTTPDEAFSEQHRSQSQMHNQHPTTMNNNNNQQQQQQQLEEIVMTDIIRNLVKNSNPKVIRAVTEAAIQASCDNNTSSCNAAASLSVDVDKKEESIADKEKIQEAQKAAVIGLVTSKAIEKARSHEQEVSRVLTELVDQRMQKLENRMALMDDLECILEAERVALELERRDLYTARCREWFGGH